MGEVARLFFGHGQVVLCTFVSPTAADRARARARFPEGRFFEVFVDVDLATARARDPKGLYQKADAGEIAGFTGVSAPYEAPANPDVTLRTSDMTVGESVEQLWAALVAAGVLRG